MKTIKFDFDKFIRAGAMLLLSITVTNCSDGSEDGDNNGNNKIEVTELEGSWFQCRDRESHSDYYLLTFTKDKYVEYFQEFDDTNCVMSVTELEQTSFSTIVIGDEITAEDGLTAKKLDLLLKDPSGDVYQIYYTIFRVADNKLYLGKPEPDVPELRPTSMDINLTFNKLE